MPFCCLDLGMEQMSPNYEGCLAEHHLLGLSQVLRSPNSTTVGVLPPSLLNSSVSHLSTWTGDYVRTKSCSTLGLKRGYIAWLYATATLSYVCGSKNICLEDPRLLRCV